MLNLFFDLINVNNKINNHHMQLGIDDFYYILVPVYTNTHYLTQSPNCFFSVFFNRK